MNTNIRRFYVGFNGFVRIVALVGLFALFGCSGDDEAASEGNLTKVAITQIVTHPGIDAVRNGFETEMARLGYIEGENIEYERSNANGDFASAQAIARKLAGSPPDLVFSISTPSTQALAEAFKQKDTPIVFGAITDPVAAGLVNSINKPGGMITGTSDVWPYEDQFRLLKRLVPEAKVLGVIHNPTEANSKASMALVEKAGATVGFELLEVPVFSSGEVVVAARSLVGRCDAMYIPADNTVISGLASLVTVSEENGIPLMPGDTSNVEVGGFGTIGHDYSEIGVETARIAHKVLEGTPPAEIPVTTPQRYEYYFNLRSAKKTGVSIPAELLDEAVKVYE